MSPAETGKPVPKPARRLRFALQHLDALSQLLRGLATHPSQSAERWEAHLIELQRLHAALSEELSGAQEERFFPGLPQLRAFGALLRDRRNGAGFSRNALAKLAKISEATIKLIESARQPPSRPTLIRLVSVERLRLTWEDVNAHLGTAQSPALLPPTAFERREDPFNCFLPPDAFLRRKQDLERLLRGPGGYIPHSALYVDECSAVDYLEHMIRSPEALERRVELPIHELVRALAQHGLREGRNGCHLVALGPGDAVTESRLASLLLETMEGQSLDLSLLDFSPSLLQAAFTQAAGLFEGRPNVRVTAALVDFLKLSIYPQLLRAEPERRRVFTLLGGTFDELDKPLAFLQYGLPESQPGDLLVLDFRTPAAPSDSPELILSRDPWLCAPLPASSTAWFTGPLRRACSDTGVITLSADLENGAAAGGYTVNVRADVSGRGTRLRRFSLFRQSRHDPDHLAESLSAVGWTPLVRLPYGHTYRGCLMLCEHRPLTLSAAPALEQRWGPSNSAQQRSAPPVSSYPPIATF